MNDMDYGFRLASVYIANGMAIVLAIQLLINNDWRFAKSYSEHIKLRRLIILAMTACVIDPLVFFLDGSPGMLCRIAIYIGNVLLYADNVLIGIGVLDIICYHLLGSFPRSHRILCIFLGAFCGVVLLANTFTPLVFSLDANNVYHRESMFFIYTAVECVMILDGIGVYLYAKNQGGILKYFPVLQFLIPSILGIALQCWIYGISVIFPAAMLSFSGLFNSLRNEALHMDALTGLLNRTYLDGISDKIKKEGSKLPLAVFMIDLNDFKGINDKYGHSEGDAALIKTAELLKKTVGPLGNVVRYAGDEFVILLNTKLMPVIEGCMKGIEEEFDNYNLSSGKEYKLTLSIGYCALNEDNSSMDDMLRVADEYMYKAKKKYYLSRKNDRREKTE